MSRRVIVSITAVYCISRCRQVVDVVEILKLFFLLLVEFIIVVAASTPNMGFPRTRQHDEKSLDILMPHAIRICIKAFACLYSGTISAGFIFSRKFNQRHVVVFYGSSGLSIIMMNCDWFYFIGGRLFASFYYKIINRSLIYQRSVIA